MSRFHPLHMMVFAAGLLLLGAPSTNAADGMPKQLAQSQQSTTVSEENIRSYAAAVPQVQEVSAEWQQRIQKEAKTQKDIEKMHQEANQELVQVIKTEGLSVREYNRITQLAAKNPDLKSKITSYME
ncbi:MAG: DUF4168 domain-containing protein [Rhodospirillales bacterium]